MKKLTKRILATALALSLICSMSAVAFATDDVDVEEDAVVAVDATDEVEAIDAELEDATEETDAEEATEDEVADEADAEEVTDETDAEEVTEEEATEEEVAEETDAEEVTDETDAEEVTEEEVVAPTAAPTASTVLIDGEEVAFDAYNIADNNYFKLRDIAAVLNGTDAQFEITWNQDAQAIEMISGEAYTEVGGELELGEGAEMEYIDSVATIYLDGEEIELTAYTIAENNYFKLRDLGEALGFNVSWDQDAQTISVASDEEYTAD